MVRINKNNGIEQTQTGKQAKAPKEKTSKKGVKNGGKKVALAMAALATGAMAGIGIATAVKKGKINETISSYNKIADKISETLASSETLSEKFDVELFTAEKDKLIQAAKGAKTKAQAEGILSLPFKTAELIVGSEKFGIEPEEFLKSNGCLTEEVQQALVERNLLKVSDLASNTKIKCNHFADTVDGILANLQKENPIFEGIKPHTYDKTKEHDQVFTQLRYTSAKGYCADVCASTDNMRLPLCGDSAVIQIGYTGNLEGGKYISGKGPFSAHYGINGETGRPVVKFSLELPYENSASRGLARRSISFVAPKKGYTPVQKDVIEVAKRLTEEEKAYFEPLMKNEEAFSYDAFLSVIQHLKENAEFMAREIVE